jgi:hypothetical protein
MKPRFSLKAMLAMVTLTAVGVIAAYNARRLSTAEGEVEYAQGLWEAGRSDLASLIIAERKLFEVESDVPWISQREAVGNHLGRLEVIADRAQARFEIGHFAGSEEAHKAKAEELKRLEADIAALRAGMER